MASNREIMANNDKELRDVKTLANVITKELSTIDNNNKSFTYPRFEIKAIEGISKDIKLLFANAAREITVNAVSHNGSKLILSELEVEGQTFFAIFTNSDPFESGDDIANSFLHPFSADGKGPSVFGAGGFLSCFAASSGHGFFIVGSKCTGNSFTYCIVKKQEIKIAKADVTRFLQEPMNNIIGSCVDEINNIFLIPIHKTVDNITSDDCNVFNRLMGEVLTNQIEMRVITNKRLNKDNKMPTRNIVKKSARIPSFDIRKNHFIGKEITIQSNDSITLSGEYKEELAEVDFNISCKIGLVPCFKKRKGRHPIPLTSNVSKKNITHLGDRESLPVSITSSNSSVLLGKGGERLKDQPILISNSYSAWRLSMTLGLPYVGKTEMEKQNGISNLEILNYLDISHKDKVRIKKQADSYWPSCSMEIDLQPVRISTKSKTIEQKEMSFDDFAEVMGEFTSTFMIANKTKLMDIVDQLFVELKRQMTPEDIKIINIFWQAKETPMYRIPLIQIIPGLSPKEKYDIVSFNSGENLCHISSSHLEKGPYKEIVFLRNHKSGKIVKPSENHILCHSKGWHLTPVMDQENGYMLVIDKLTDFHGKPIKKEEYKQGCTPSKFCKISFGHEKTCPLNIFIDGLPEKMPGEKRDETKEISRKPPHIDKLEVEDKDIIVEQSSLEDKTIVAFPKADSSLIPCLNSNHEFALLFNSTVKLPENHKIRRQINSCFRNLCYLNYEGLTGQNKWLNKPEFNSSVNEETAQVIGGPKSYTSVNNMSLYWEMDKNRIRKLTEKLHRLARAENNDSLTMDEIEQIKIDIDDEMENVITTPIEGYNVEDIRKKISSD